MDISLFPSSSLLWINQYIKVNMEDVQSFLIVRKEIVKYSLPTVWGMKKGAAAFLDKVTICLLLLAVFFRSSLSLHSHKPNLWDASPYPPPLTAFQFLSKTPIWFENPFQDKISGESLSCEKLKGSSRTEIFLPKREKNSKSPYGGDSENYTVGLLSAKMKLYLPEHSYKTSKSPQKG